MKGFAAFRFDTLDQTLWLGQVKVPLTRKAREVLGCLVEAGGRTVSKGEILERVWRGTHVHPDNVKVLISEIRMALHDDSRNPRFIRNEIGQGYAFVAPLRDIPRVSRTRAIRARDSSPVHTDALDSGESLYALANVLADLVRDLVTQQLTRLLPEGLPFTGSPPARAREWTPGSARGIAEIVRWPRLARDLSARTGAHHGRFRN